MKSVLFLVVIFFFNVLLYGQNNTNTNNSGGKEEKKVVVPEVKAVKVKQSEAETINSSTLSSPAPATLNLELNSPNIISKDVMVSKEMATAKFIAKQSEYNHQRTRRSYTDSQKEELNQLLREVSAQSPASFESLLFYYENGQFDLKRSTALLKAQEMQPNNAEVKKQMTIYYFLTQKENELRQSLIDIFNSGMYPKAIQNYNIDALKSVPQNGILVTHGMEDSFGALFAQRVLRKREDVNIICLEWLNSPQWRTNLIAQGIKLPNNDNINIKYLEEFCDLNKDKRVSLALTIPKEYFLPVLNKLYVSGLVLEYKDIPTDNSLTNEVLWRTTLEKKLLETKDHDLVLNYIPMMAQLSKYYEGQKQTSEKVKMDSEIKEVVKSRGKSLK